RSAYLEAFHPLFGIDISAGQQFTTGASEAAEDPAAPVPAGWMRVDRTVPPRAGELPAAVVPDPVAAGRLSTADLARAALREGHRPAGYGPGAARPGRLAPGGGAGVGAAESEERPQATGPWGGSVLRVVRLGAGLCGIQVLRVDREPLLVHPDIGPADVGLVARAELAARPQRVPDVLHLDLRRGPHLLAAVRHRAGPEVRAARTPGGLLVGCRLALHLD